MHKLNIVLNDYEYGNLLALNIWTVLESSHSRDKNEEAMAALTKKLIDACTGKDEPIHNLTGLHIKYKEKQD